MPDGASAGRPVAVPRGFFPSAALMDGGFFLIMVAMPFKVLALGGGAVALGLVPAIGAISYSACAPVAGRLSDRLDRTRLCLAGGLVLIVCAWLAFLTTALAALLALQLLMGLGKALYWPGVQATLGDLSPPGRRVAVLGFFNVSWSGGKTVGFLAGGVLLSCCGFDATFATGAGCVALAYVVLPKRRAVERARAGMVAAPTPAGNVVGTEPTLSPTTLQLFRRMGWIANTAAYGALGVLTHHLPQWFSTHGWNESRYGLVLGGILVCQTVVLLLLAGPLRFTYSPWRLWAPQIVAVAALALVPVMPGYAPLLVLTVPLGLSFGVCYAASLFYSLEADTARGRNAGIHEALVGAGGLLPPVLGGLAARATGWLGAPYIVAAVVLLVALVVQMRLAHRVKVEIATA